MRLKKGDILKLSEEGLDWFYKYNPKGREGASQWRFEYRSRSRKASECLSVIKVGTGYYQTYHKSFLAKVD